jgi:hypothetical protein
MLCFALVLLLAAPAAHAQTPCPTTCDEFVAPSDLSRFVDATGITAAVYAGDARQDADRRDDPNARVAACLNGELRGVAGATPFSGQVRYFLSVAGAPNERGTPITLRYCSAQDGDLVAPLVPASNFDNTPVFEAGQNYGEPSIPYRLQADPVDLPVELVAFSAIADGDAVRLIWETASETNNAGFWVEHDAGEGFARSEWIGGAGTTLERQRYAYRTPRLAAGLHRFRLRQTDLDGAAELSPVVEVTLGSEALTLYSVAQGAPDGAVEARFSVGRSGAAVATLYDVLGRRVARVGIGSQAGQVHRVVLGERLAAGLYVLTVESGGQRRARSVVVAR